MVVGGCRWSSKICMGRQTSQYSLCISVIQFTFYMVNSTFHTVNFLLFIWLTRVFYVANSTSYMVNFLLFMVDFESFRNVLCPITNKDSCLCSLRRTQRLKAVFTF